MSNTVGRWGELPHAFKNAVSGYYTTGSTDNDLALNADVIGCALAKLSTLHGGTQLALTRVLIHYASTSTDKDKDDILQLLTQENGAVAMISTLKTFSRELDIWGEILGSISDE